MDDAESLQRRRIFSRRGIIRPPFNPELQRYWYQRHQLFSRYERGVRLDAESWFSATPEVVAATSSRLLTDADSGKLFVDGFCGAGGNAIQQALHDRHGIVVAIDIDPEKVALARHNARIYGVEQRILFIVGDFVELAPRLKAHVCFLSPPWGGPEQAKAASFPLASLAPLLSGTDGATLFDHAARIAPTIGYFLPVGVLDEELAELATRHPSGHCARCELIWGTGDRKGKPGTEASDDFAAAGEASMAGNAPAARPLTNPKKRRSDAPRAMLACFFDKTPAWLGASMRAVHASVVMCTA